MGRDAAPGWGQPPQREAAWTGHSSRDSGRPPTDLRKVVANPGISAGSTVASCWLRLVPWTAVKKHAEDLTHRLATLDIGSHINTAPQLRPKVAAQCRL